eukprot:g8904.t1
MESLLKEGEEYWGLERVICTALSSDLEVPLTANDVHKCSASKSFDYRVLHELLHLLYNKERSTELLEYLRLDEQLLDIGDDLVDYEDDVLDNSFNIYRCYIRMFGKQAQMNLVQYITKVEQDRAVCLSQLNEELQGRIHSRQLEAATAPGSEKWIFPAPIYDEEEYRKGVEDDIETTRASSEDY